MKALLKKDFYVLLKQMWIFVLMIVILTAVGNNFYIIFSVVWASMLPYTALAYDERSHWDQLAAMMPYSTREIVLSKYVLGWICMAGAMALCLVVSLARMVFSSTTPDFSTLFMALLIGVIAIDITLPLVLRFGVERGRMGFMAIIAGVAIVGGILVSNVAIFGPTLLTAPMVVAVMTAVPATILSIPLSIRMYQTQSRI